ncbi:dTDP-4-dehydrorhamnose reductase [Shewanella sp. ALD9]|uniref:dTDP-4-dehydrorhamnose reductase n=1 Tax=Shewanella sp. ALD9 TaxID=2058330 RepID=UPI0012FEAF8B|nr:dTDP-4-dehydrorhamnose reductase [Shewanella sp. ALD9]
MKILTFGQTGQLAQALKRTQPKTAELIQLNHQLVDITQPQLIDEALAFYRPDIIINCAAYTNVEKAQINPAAVMQTNALAVEYMAKAASNYGIKLIQLSTDYVFDGRSSTPYSVTQKPSAINAYGQSKLLAEEILLGYQSALFCIVRTSWLYHHSGNNFVTTMLKLMEQSHNQQTIGSSADNPIKVVNDQTGSPTMVDDFALFLWKLCSQKQWSAIYHWSNAGKCTWYEFAQEIKTQGIALGLLPQSIYLQPITSEQYTSIVNRPTFSVLDTRLSHSIAMPKPWQQQLAQCLNELVLSKV